MKRTHCSFKPQNPSSISANILGLNICTDDDVEKKTCFEIKSPLCYPLKKGHQIWVLVKAAFDSYIQDA